MTDEPVVLINSFEVLPQDAEHFIDAWEKARDYLETQPGYVETALHQSVTPNADFSFVNVARWASIEAFQAATQSSGFREAAAHVATYKPHAGLYRVVRT